MDSVSSFDKSDFSLHELDCRELSGFVFVRLGKTGVDFDSFFEPLVESLKPWPIAELQIARKINYDVNANWKLIFQNYSECYHCPIVHPALNRLTPYKGSSNDFSAGPILGGPMQLADDCQSMTTDGKAAGKIFKQLDEHRRQSVAYYTVFPTMFVSPHPDYVLVHRLIPIAPDRTQVICEFLFSEESINSPESNLDGAVEFWDLTNRQDWEVCELTQKGMSSVGYQPGPYSDLESIVAAFDAYYKSVIK